MRSQAGSNYDFIPTIPVICGADEPIQFKTDIERSRHTDCNHTLFAYSATKKSTLEAVYLTPEWNLEILLSPQPSCQARSSNWSANNPKRPLRYECAHVWMEWESKRIVLDLVVQVDFPHLRPTCLPIKSLSLSVCTPTYTHDFIYSVYGSRNT